MPLRHFAILLIPLVAACSPTPDTAEESESEAEAEGETLVLEVDSETATCTGVAEQQCLKVRTPGDDDWQFFYSPIEGFEFEPGFIQILEVERTAVPNPPADGSSFRYRLLAVVSKEPAS